MLAQNFKTAADLGIREIEVDALIKVLGMLERGEISFDEFDMGMYRSSRGTDCGTVGCLCGWAFTVSHQEAFPEVAIGYDGTTSRALQKRLPGALLRLFNAQVVDTQNDYDFVRNVISLANPENAAIALRSYLTTGEANWAEALAS